MSNLLPTAGSTASATGNPRNKTSLKPGHSIMDWIRLRGSGVDLAGTKGVVTPVSLAELRKHNKKSDAWMAIRGKVYNVTRYMDFHPGGVEELLKGVGMDATKVFDDVHAWVNYEQMLNKCYIGPLCAATTSPKIATSTSSSQLSTGSGGLAANFRLPFSLSANNFISNTLAASTAAVGVELSREAPPPQLIPRFDWIQKTTELVVIFYTRAMCSPGLVIESLEGEDRSLEVRILVERSTFLVKFSFTDAVRWPCAVRSSVETGKVEISLTKAEPKLWSSYGQMEMTKANEMDLSGYEYKVVDQVAINHDSFALSLEPVKRVFMVLPVGHHVSVTCDVDGHEISRSYTPVPLSYVGESAGACCLPLLVKFYKDGTLSRQLCEKKALAVRVSPPRGSFSMAQLKDHARVAFLAAGSGLTPFLAVIDQLVGKTNNQLESLSLHYFNKTESDIWCRSPLDAMTQSESRLRVVHHLSDADASWDGERGRITRDQIVALTDPHSRDHVTFIGVCGPPAFNRLIVELLKAVDFPAAGQHVFQG